MTSICHRGRRIAIPTLVIVLLALAFIGAAPMPAIALEGVSEVPPSVSVSLETNFRFDPVAGQLTAFVPLSEHTWSTSYPTTAPLNVIIDWGDGVIEDKDWPSDPANPADLNPNVVMYGASATDTRAYRVDAYHTYAGAGQYSAYVTWMESTPSGIIYTRQLIHLNVVATAPPPPPPPPSGPTANIIVTYSRDISTVAGKAFPLIIHFSEASPYNKVANINWGDGTSTMWMSPLTDGSGSYYIVAYHTYPDPGAYRTTTTILVYDEPEPPSGIWDYEDYETVNVTVTAAGPPVADLQASPLQGAAPLIVTFDGSGSTDPDRDIASYVIDFGDGTSPASGAGAPAQAVQHTYLIAGDWTASLTVTDSGGRSSTARVAVTVTPDNVPPAIVPPLDLVIEGNAPGGAAGISIGSAQATDNLDPSPTLSNDAPAFFALGITIVTWTATDASGNTAAVTQQVTVVDTTAPALSDPSPLTIEANAAGGAAVTLQPPAVSDIADPSPTISSDAPAFFPLGLTIVTWSATDASGNQSTVTQQVTVVDTTPPQLPPLSAVSAAARGNQPVAVYFDLPPATDIVDGSVPVVASPPSGSLFPSGANSVSVTATDSSGNVSSAIFDVIVARGNDDDDDEDDEDDDEDEDDEEDGVRGQMEDLLDEVEEADIGKSFRAKLRQALRAYREGRDGSAKSLLRAFIAQVTAQTGKRIEPDTAESLISSAHRIQAQV